MAPTLRPSHKTPTSQSSAGPQPKQETFYDVVKRRIPQSEIPNASIHYAHA